MLSPASGKIGMHNVRVLSLTPPGVSSNAVLRSVIEDIIQCCVDGVEVTTEKGGKLVIFLELVVYIGEYPGMSHCLDILGHNASVPCTPCMFRRADLSSMEECSRYAYTSSRNRSDPAYRRTKDRMRLLRAALDCEESTLQDVGLKILTDEQLSQLPLHLLSDKLDMAQERILRTRDNVPVTNTSFDSYQSCAIAPSHILYGVTKNIINANIRCCTPAQRKEVDRLLFKVLSSCDTIKEQVIIDVANMKLHSMSISNTFSVLLIAPWAFRVVLQLDRPDVFLEQNSKQTLLLFALYKFRELYTETTFLPLLELDGLGAVNEMNNSELYFNRLKLMCVTYVDIVNQLCGLDNEIAYELDKPNIHRLVELYHHSVPRYGHVRNFDELPFEAAHQPLKRALGRSNNRKGHIFAIQRVIANKWRLRMGLACQTLHCDDGKLTEDHCLLLVMACFGHCKWLDEGVISQEDVRAAFNPPVRQSFKAYAAHIYKGRSSSSAVGLCRRAVDDKMLDEETRKGHYQNSWIVMMRMPSRICFAFWSRHRQGQQCPAASKSIDTSRPYGVLQKLTVRVLFLLNCSQRSRVDRSGIIPSPRVMRYRF